MKTTCLILTAALLTTQLHAEFRTWTRDDGKTAQLELIGKVGEGDETEGRFKMRNGRTVNIPIGSLIDSDAELVANWAPPEEVKEVESGPESVFDKVLDGSLVKLDGRSLKKHEPETKPAKYYIFYYTASWCPPCRTFTPTLVKFYEKEKKDNNNFELVLISSDRDEKAMTEYAKDASMPWPQLKFSDVKKFKSSFDHGVRGIPAVIVCDLEGNIVANTRDLNEIAKLVK